MTTPPSVLAAIERFMAECYPGIAYSVVWVDLGPSWSPGDLAGWVPVDEEGRRIQGSPVWTA